jgi:hypothetical protein
MHSGEAVPQWAPGKPLQEAGAAEHKAPQKKDAIKKDPEQQQQQQQQQAGEQQAGPQEKEAVSAPSKVTANGGSKAKAEEGQQGERQVPATTKGQDPQFEALRQKCIEREELSPEQVCGLVGWLGQLG